MIPIEYLFNTWKKWIVRHKEDYLANDIQAIVTAGNKLRAMTNLQRQRYMSRAYQETRDLLEEPMPEEEDPPPGKRGRRCIEYEFDPDGP